MGIKPALRMILNQLVKEGKSLSEILKEPLLLKWYSSQEISIAFNYLKDLNFRKENPCSYWFSFRTYKSQAEKLGKNHGKIIRNALEESFSKENHL